MRSTPGGPGRMYEPILPAMFSLPVTAPISSDQAAQNLRTISIGLSIRILLRRTSPNNT